MFNNNDKYLLIYKKFLTIFCAILPIIAALSLTILSPDKDLTIMLLMCNLVPAIWFYWEIIKKKYSAKGLFSLIPMIITLVISIICITSIKKNYIFDEHIIVGLVLQLIAYIAICVCDCLHSTRIVNIIIGILYGLFTIILIALAASDGAPIYLLAGTYIAILVSGINYLVGMLLLSICIDIKLIRNKLYNNETDNSALTNICDSPKSNAPAKSEVLEQITTPTQYLDESDTATNNSPESNN